MTSVKIITAEEFKNRSFQIIQIPYSKGRTYSHSNPNHRYHGLTR